VETQELFEFINNEELQEEQLVGKFEHVKQEESHG